MATYAIGDVQGCMESLERLLRLIDYRRRRDRLWLAGDLVDRGPRSADVLRWARAAGDDVVAVLGNHDVHLLARAAGRAAKKKRDTLDDVLHAPDRDELVAWLRHRPLVHRERGFFLVHAGVLPTTDLDEAERLARQIETALRGPEGDRLLGDGGDRGRLRQGLAVFTKLRVCTPEGRADFDFDGGPGDAPRGMRPWYELRHDRETLLHGHWSRLGFLAEPGHFALDSGCVYGGALTAVRLEDRKVFRQPNAET